MERMKLENEELFLKGLNGERHVYHTNIKRKRSISNCVDGCLIFFTVVFDFSERLIYPVWVSLLYIWKCEVGVFGLGEF